VGVKYKQNFANLVHDVFVFYSHSFKKLKHVLAPKNIIIKIKATEFVAFIFMM